MAFKIIVSVLICVLSSLVAAEREGVAPHRIGRRQTSDTPNIQKRASIELWFGNFTVGNSNNLELLLDTGSTDLYINKGLYKKSKSASIYHSKNATFNITYEGVNKQGTGFETVLGTVDRDVVSQGGLSIPNQPVGSITNYTVVDAPPKKTAIAGDGIIGFLGSTSKYISGLVPPANSWFYNLCGQKLISACRFGLAFGTNEKGVQIIGKVERSLFSGDLQVGPLHTEIYPLWTTRSDVSVDNDLLEFANQTIIFDSGTQNIQAPLAIAEKIFKTFGYKYTITTGGPNPNLPSENIKFLTGYYPCDNPPTLSFSYPAQSDIDAGAPGTSKTTKKFNVFKSTWPVAVNGDNNCTAVLAGTNADADPYNSTNAWLVGQPFFQGHYIDHNAAGNSMGIADLINPANVAGSD